MGKLLKFVSNTTSESILTNNPIILDPFPQKPSFLRVCCRNLFKTLLKKEKLLVTSKFSFSHTVFYFLEELSAIFIKSRVVVCIANSFSLEVSKICQNGKDHTLPYSSRLSNSDCNRPSDFVLLVSKTNNVNNNGTVSE